MAAPGKDIFYCSFFNLAQNKCRIYQKRPFECRLYPFLLQRQKNKFYLAADLNCPFVQKNLKSRKFKAYLRYLTRLFGSPALKNLLRQNTRLFQRYSGIAVFGELEF